MAPRVEQNYHSRGGRDKYALRSFKQKEDNRLQPRGTNASNTKGKEYFFSYLGLKIKRRQSKMPNKNLIVSTGVRADIVIRECSVIILGVKCSLCYKCFKCKTDLGDHYKLKHTSGIKLDEVILSESQCTENGLETGKQTSQCLDLVRRDPGKNVKIKPQRLRLTFKIGDEVVASKSMKRKHLKRRLEKRKIDSFAQTENELIGNYNGYENCIDPCNSPCQCCNADRYSASSNVTAKRILPEESIGEEGNENLRGAKESREVSCTQGDCSTICYFPERTTVHGKTSSVAGSGMLPSPYSNYVSMPHDSCKTLESNGNNTNNSFKSLNGDINVPSNQTAQCTNNNEKTTKYINVNNNIEPVNMSNVYILPVVVPIQLPDKNTPAAGATVQLLIQSTPLYLHIQQNQQQGPELQRKQHEEQQTPFQGVKVPNKQQKEQEQELLGRTSSISTEDNSDDIQELLIIGGRQKMEFNHESPTRLQQEQLSYTTVEEMMKTQVSPSRANHVVDSAREKAVSRDANDQRRETEAKKRRIDMNPNEGKLSFANHIASYSVPVETCAPNNAKGNLMCKNIGVPSELSNINYEKFEINNNIDCVREHVSHLSWKATANLPPLIDLVNDD